MLRMAAQDDNTGKDRFTSSGPPPPRAPKPVTRLSLDAYRLELQSQVEWFEQVRAFVGGRIQMLKFTLNLQNMTKAQIEVGLGGLNPDGRGMVEALIAQMQRSATMSQRIATAVARFDGATALIRLIVAYLQDHDRSTVETYRFMSDHDIAKVRGQLYGVTTFDALFRDDPVLNQIFPPIARSPQLDTSPLSRALHDRPTVPDSPNRSRLSLGPPRGATAPLVARETAKLESSPPPVPLAKKSESVALGFLGSLIGRCQEILDDQTVRQ
jgi:hypothetical protein